MRVPRDAGGGEGVQDRQGKDRGRNCVERLDLDRLREYLKQGQTVSRGDTRAREENPRVEILVTNAS